MHLYVHEIKDEEKTYITLQRLHVYRTIKCQFLGNRLLAQLTQILGFHNLLQVSTVVTLLKMKWL